MRHSHFLQAHSVTYWKDKGRTSELLRGNKAAQNMKALFFGNIPGVRALIAVFCFILQRPTCLAREQPQACQGEIAYAKEELDSMGCPDGRLCSRSPPDPCPPGTFLYGMDPHNTPFCHPCPPEFFNPWHGQNACFPCGSEATQPEEGKDTCICRKPGRVFQDFYLLDRPSSPRAVGHPCNLDQGKNSVPLYVIKVNGYSSGSSESSCCASSPESFLGKLRKEHQPHPWSLSLNSTHSGDMSGIQNPIVCLQTNDTLAFLVTHGHYPEYDLGHFYNTLQQFDWGRFRALAEELQLAEQSPRLFLQQFQLPGVYVFHLNSNRHRKMYLRTLPPGGQCFADGPFASATPRYLIQSGIAKIPKPVKRPHWPGVLGEMMLLLGLCLLLLAAEAVALAAEEESKRRQSLAGQYAASLSHQLELLHQDLCARQGQWASFCSVLMEAQWLLKTPSSSNPGKSPQPGQSPKGVPSQLDILLGHLSQAMLQEGHRLKAWGFLGTGTGAELLQPASACPQEGADDIIVNPVTKLMVPGPNCMMLPVSGHMGPIPPGYFIHPDTGRVLPQTGHLGYDLLKAALIPITDYNADVVRTSEVAVLPYLPYPTSPVTGCPPATRLPTLQPRRTSQLGALMSDPITGIEVPVLAVTLHPQTRQWLTLGGTYCNPLTKTLAPLELGGPMKDPVTGGIVPILGVGLDEHTGQVLAVGGLQDGTGSLLLPGDNFEEPLSGKTVRLLGASQQAGQLLPHPGGSQALLDSNVLVAQRQVILRLQQCQETPGSRAQGLLESAIRDMRRALALSLHHILQQAQRLERQLQAARDIEATGGCIGLMCYPRTELWVPALYGMEIPDPEGSGLMVPILGMHRDGDSGNTTPLAGTMEDTAGKGLVPISIGAQAIDPLTGEHGPVIGAHMDPSARVVVPVVQLLEALPRGVRDPNLILLEQELRAHQQYWQLREQEEQQLAEHLWHLSQELHFCPGHEATLQLKAAEEACAALEACYLQETERRARALSMLSSPERCLLSQADKKEWEEEAQVLLGVRKVLHSLGQASEKLRKTSTRLQGQAEEVCLQQSEDQSPRVWNHHRKVLQHLSDEFREVVRDRQNFLNRALGNLQYHRELSHLQLLHIQVTVSGTPVCLENYPGDRFYGTVTTCLGNQAALCPLLIPFLKGITAMLIEDQGHHLGLEDQAPAVGPRNSLQNLLKTQTMQGELVTVQTMHLSAWEFVVYQYGLSVLHLLIPQLQVHLFLAFCEAVSHEAVEVRVARKRLKRHQIISRKKFLQQ
ncbi:putative gene 32742 [Cricetulus griseus]